MKLPGTCSPKDAKKFCPDIGDEANLIKEVLKMDDGHRKCIPTLCNASPPDQDCCRTFDLLKEAVEADTPEAFQKKHGIQHGSTTRSPTSPIRRWTSVVR